MAVFLIAVAVLLAVAFVAFAVPRLRQADRRVDAILQDHETPTTTAVPHEDSAA